MCVSLTAHGFVTNKDTLLMGSAFNFSAVHEHEDSAILAIEAAVKEVGRIEAKISSWNDNSETSRINSNAGIKPVKVSEELFFFDKTIQENLKIEWWFF